MTTNRPKAAAVSAPEWPLRPDRMVHNKGFVIHQKHCRQYSKRWRFIWGFWLIRRGGDVSGMRAGERAGVKWHIVAGIPSFARHFPLWLVRFTTMTTAVFHVLPCSDIVHDRSPLTVDGRLVGLWVVHQKGWSVQKYEKIRTNLLCVLTHCGRVTKISVFNTVKLGTSASSS
jgi:hypothetical protein